MSIGFYHVQGWSCGVSDETGGAIQPTSASNLQHEKDTLMTPYLPPTIVCPCPAPSAWCCSLSFQPKSNGISGYPRFLLQLCNQTDMRGSLSLIYGLSSSYTSQTILWPRTCVCSSCFFFAYEASVFWPKYFILIDFLHFHLRLLQVQVEKDRSLKKQAEGVAYMGCEGFLFWRSGLSRWKLPRKRTVCV